MVILLTMTNKQAIANINLLNSSLAHAANLRNELQKSTDEIIRLENEVKIELERATHYRELWQEQSAEMRKLSAELREVASKVRTMIETNPIFSFDFV